MTLPQRLWLAVCLLAAVFCAICPPWRIRVILRGDDRYPAWRSAPIWEEPRFSAETMAAVASARLGTTIAPSDVEAQLDASRAWFQLGGILAVSGLGWILLGNLPRPGTPPKP